MAVRFVSNAVLLDKFLDELAVKTITAAAIFVTGQAKKNARGGFKGGAFVTRGWQSIRYEVTRTGLGRASALVGATEKHFMFWEVGHHNLFTRRFERNRWLSRAMMEGRTLRDMAVLAAADQVARKYSALSVTGTLVNIRGRTRAAILGARGRLAG